MRKKSCLIKTNSMKEIHAVSHDQNAIIYIYILNYKRMCEAGMQIIKNAFWF